MSPTRRALIQALSDGAFHSGEALGRELGVSRAAVWKQIRKLQQEGWAIDCVPGQGYRCRQLSANLNAEAILAALPVSAQPWLAGIRILPEVDSTNSELLRQATAGLPAGTVCVAEWQTAGRGRRGRAWVSPQSGNIYASVLWRYAGGASVLEGLSLVVGLVLLETLADMGIPDLALKWPNDVLARQRKLAGILLEMGGDPSGDCQVVIGIGLNCQLPDALDAAIGQPWIDLSRLLPAAPDRNHVLGVLLGRLLPVLSDYDRQGFSAYRDRWLQHDACRGQPVQIWQGDALLTGVARGVDAQGALCVETAAGVHVFHGGEVSLRVVP